MLNAIKQFIDQYIEPPAGQNEPSEHALQLATAALMFEMTRADDEIKDVERRAVTEAVRSKFDLSEQETQALMDLAEREATEATDYFQFTSLINKHFSAEQKIKVVEHLWQVAYSDRHLDMYEEHLVRKIAELLYVPHHDYIAAKLRVQEQLEP